MNTKDAVHSFCHCIPNKWHLMSVMLSASNCLDWISSITGTSISDTLKNVENFSKDFKSLTFCIVKITEIYNEVLEQKTK